MERFVLGLRDPLFRYVIEKCPANFDDAVSHATAVESLEKFHIVGKRPQFPRVSCSSEPHGTWETTEMVSPA